MQAPRLRLASGYATAQLRPSGVAIASSNSFAWRGFRRAG